MSEPNGSIKDTLNSGPGLLDYVDGRAVVDFKNLLSIESGKQSLTRNEFEKLRIVNRVGDFGGNSTKQLFEQPQGTLIKTFTSLLKEGPFSPFVESNEAKKHNERVRTPLVLKYPDDIPDIKALSLINDSLRSAIDIVSPKLLPNFDIAFDPRIDRQVLTTVEGVKVRGESTLLHESRHAIKWSQISGENCYIYMDFRYFGKDGSLKPKLVAALYPNGKTYVGSSLAPLYPSLGDVTFYKYSDPETKKDVINILSRKPVWGLIKDEYKQQFIADPLSDMDLPAPLPDGRTEIVAGEIFASAMMELFSRKKIKDYSIIDTSLIVKK